MVSCTSWFIDNCYSPSKRAKGLPYRFKNGGLTFTIILGRKLAVLAYQIFIFLPYFLVIWFYFKGETSILSLTTLLTITIPLNLGKEARNGNFNKLDQSTAKLHTVFGLLYLLGFIFK